ncbi:MAG: OB-fold protein, partial [Chthoniobacterales bacterium]
PLSLAMVLFASSALAQDAPVDWRTIATEFSQDQAAAEAKYQGKMLTVTGPVSAIAAGDDTLDNPSVAVTLSTQDGPGPDVKCLFENEDLEPNTQLYVPDDGSEVLIRTVDQVGNETGSKPLIETGQQITVTGSYVEFDAGDIVLRHCRLAGQ